MICRRPVDYRFVIPANHTWSFELPEWIDASDPTVGACTQHRELVELLLARVDRRPAQQPLALEEKVARRKRRTEATRQRRRAEYARREVGKEEWSRRFEASYQRDLAEYKRRFERGLTKRTRLAAARQLGEHTHRREPAEAARAYEYILATRPPEDRSELFELAKRLRVVGSLAAAEQAFRKLRDEDRTDEDSLFALIDVLRKLDRGDEADALVRWHERLLALRDLLEHAVIRAKQYHVGGRVERIAPVVLDLLEPDEDARRVVWSMSLPIPRGVGFALLTDRRLLVVQDYEYLDSGVQRGRPAEHASFEPDSEFARSLFR